MTAPVTIHGPWTLGTNLTATGNVVDASGGGGVTGLGTPGYVAQWSSPTNLAASSIYDAGAGPKGVILTNGVLSTPDAIGTAGNGVNLTVQPGVGGSSSGNGGNLNLYGGYGTAGNGGSINIYAGASGAGPTYIKGALRIDTSTFSINNGQTNPNYSSIIRAGGNMQVQGGTLVSVVSGVKGSFINQDQLFLRGNNAGTMTTAGIVLSGGASLEGNNPGQAAVDADTLGFAKVTASTIAPGAGFAKLQWVAGTNPGTAKLIAFAGTSNTPTTVIDNVGSGF